MPAGALFAAVTLFNGHPAEYNLKIANPNKILDKFFTRRHYLEILFMFWMTDLRNSAEKDFNNKLIPLPGKIIFGN